MNKTISLETRTEQVKEMQRILRTLPSLPRIGTKEYEHCLIALAQHITACTGYSLHKTARKVFIRACSGDESALRGDAFQGRTMYTLNGKIHHGMQPMSGGGEKVRTQKMFGGCGKVEDRPDADAIQTEYTPYQKASDSAISKSGYAGLITTSSHEHGFETKLKEREARAKRNKARRIARANRKAKTLMIKGL